MSTQPGKEKVPNHTLYIYFARAKRIPGNNLFLFWLEKQTRKMSPPHAWDTNSGDTVMSRPSVNEQKELEGVAQAYLAAPAAIVV